MSEPEIRVQPSPQGDTRHSIERLLFVADASVADTDELPPAVRAVIEAAAEVYVITPTLPGRLAWLADDVDRFRHVADKRLDIVLEHMRSIGAHASGLAGRGSVPLVIEDAIAEFHPNHVLIALRSAEHSNWQERGLTEFVEERFGLPVTTYAVDRHGHTSTADGPLLLCYDGSDHAAHAIERAGALFAGKPALVVTVWQPTSHSILPWSNDRASRETSIEAERGSRLAKEGARIAEAAGLSAKAAAVEATGPVWTTILEIADRHDAATIVMGCRAPGGLRAKVLGSVSGAVADHAARPALVIPPPVARG